MEGKNSSLIENIIVQKFINKWKKFKKEILFLIPSHFFIIPHQYFFWIAPRF